MHKITKDTAEKYINGGFYQKYPISKKVQPHFWEAVILLCEDMNADVSSLDDQIVMALIMGAIRADRFCEGALFGFFKDGSMKRWLLRLKEIDEESGGINNK